MKHEHSGTGSLNKSYFLGALCMAAIIIASVWAYNRLHNANQPGPLPPEVQVQFEVTHSGAVVDELKRLYPEANGAYQYVKSNKACAWYRNRPELHRIEVEFTEINSAKYQVTKIFGIRQRSEPKVNEGATASPGGLEEFDLKEISLDRLKVGDIIPKK